MWPALFYVNSLFSQNCLNVGVKLYIIFPNLHRDWKLGFECCSRRDFPIFSIMEGKKLEFSRLGPAW